MRFNSLGRGGEERIRDLASLTNWDYYTKVIRKGRGKGGFLRTMRKGGFERKLFFISNNESLGEK